MKKINLNKVLKISEIKKNNIYKIETANSPYFILNYEKRKEKLEIRFGTILLFPDFPFFDEGTKIIFRNHYFVFIGADKENYYLSYITTKVDKYLNSKYKNNNYILIENMSEKDDSKKYILISSRKVYQIEKKFLLQLLQDKKVLINKKLLSKISNILLKMIKNSEHIDNKIKRNLNFKDILLRKEINYSITNILNKQDKTELEVSVSIKKKIKLYSNY